MDKLNKPQSNQIINPFFTFVIFYSPFLQLEAIQLPIMYSSTKYVRKAAIGQLLTNVNQPKKMAIIV
jgi:hypothetical protein